MITTSPNDLEAARRGSQSAFIRGFFLALETNGIESAALHGWQNDFIGPLSDVDLVVSRAGFSRIAEVVHEHCRETGWQLCQILRHESTAAFCVCSWRQDPSVVVALDACSDYRKRERLLIPAEQLLAGRQQLPWGGYRLSESNELCYRFMKAAVKLKDPATTAPALAAYPKTPRFRFSVWLLTRWGIHFVDWTESSMGSAWADLESKIRNTRIHNLGHTICRIIGRILNPTGVIIISSDHQALQAVVGTFGRLYFRNNRQIHAFSPGHYRNLVSSTLLCTAELHPIWKTLLGKWLWIEMHHGESIERFTHRIAAHLAARCSNRERRPTSGQPAEAHQP